MSIRHGGHPLRRPLFFTLRRKGCASAKTTSGAPGTTGSGLRGSALGPGYGVAVAFLASLLRNIFGLGSLLAFPGSMCGALLCGLVYWNTRNLPATLAGEVFGTGIIGGLLSYPVAVAFMGVVAGSIAFYAYVVPFLVSTVGGSILAGILVFTLQKSGALKSMRAALEH